MGADYEVGSTELFNAYKAYCEECGLKPFAQRTFVSNEGFIDWNLFLDAEGGPNHAGNLCEAPVMLDPATDSIQINPSYYHIGHVSRYVKPGAKRILCRNDTADLKTAAFRNPDGTLVTVIQNPGGIREIAVVVGEKGMNLCLPDRSVTTVLIRE